jgi:hypothetical protein
MAEDVAAALSAALCSMFGSVVLGGATLLPTMSGSVPFVEGARWKNASKIIAGDHNFFTGFG